MPVRVLPSPEVLVALTKQEPVIGLLGPSGELVNWMGGIFQVPLESIMKDPDLFQKLCVLYQDETGQRIRTGQRPVFNEDFSLNERETAKKAIYEAPASMPLRGHNPRAMNEFAQSEVAAERMLELRSI
jgi:hypothetical protein